MLRHAGLLVALTALLVPAFAGTAHAAKAAPVVSKATPKHVFVGETLTIRGHHFRRGVNKNSVAFKRSGAKVVFVTAGKGTTKLLTVKLPKRLEKVLVVRNGTPVPTRLRIRVLSASFGKRFTARSKSPIVGPEKPPTLDKPLEVDPNGDCDGDGQANKVDTDDDNDLLPDTDEPKLSKLLDQCKADTDGDGVDDGYEYRSALDLNDDNYQTPNASTPYPVTKPYPNPLDSGDAGIDHDGDTLTLKDEFNLWNYTGVHTLEPLSYSAGKQFSLGQLAATGYVKHAAFMTWAADPDGDPATVTPRYDTVSLVDLGARTLATDSPWDSPPWDMPDEFGAPVSLSILDFDRSGGVPDTWEAEYYDGDANLYLDDAERDEDADGLPNQWEGTGCMTRGLWDGLYDAESPYYIKGYGTLEMDNEDSDGDGVRDGADDQDHDDVPNLMECSRSLASSGAPDDPVAYTPAHNRPWSGFVNPFNPCLPHPKARNCNQHPQVGPGAAQWAPFNEDQYVEYYRIEN